VSGWTLRYIPGTRYGNRFPSWRFGRFRDAAAGDAARRQCVHPDEIECVPEEES
jgi:hypothetical protein